MLFENKYLCRAIQGFYLAIPLFFSCGNAASEQSVGDFAIEGRLSFPDFWISPSGAIEFPGKLRIQRGGTDSPLAQSNGLIRAQPGGNVEIMPLGDYFRSAIDIYPTQGKFPEIDALAELTIHRIHPTNNGHEMLSISGLGTSQNRFGVIVEAHGTGRTKPLDFMMIQGGLLDVDRDVKPFHAVAMRVTTEGMMQFSPHRHGGQPGPVDAIILERDNPGSEGDYPSDYLRLTAKRQGNLSTQSSWRTNVSLPEPEGSAMSFQNREKNSDYETKFELLSSGDVELKSANAGVILHSPNGKRWRLSVNDDGTIRTSPLSN